MTEPKYKVGDVVLLNSGGPPMTVIDYQVTDVNKWLYICMWTSDKGLDRGQFPEACIYKTENKS